MRHIVLMPIYLYVFLCLFTSFFEWCLLKHISEVLHTIIGKQTRWLANGVNDLRYVPQQCSLFLARPPCHILGQDTPLRARSLKMHMLDVQPYCTPPCHILGQNTPLRARSLKMPML